MVIDHKGFRDDAHKALQFHENERKKNERDPANHEYHRTRVIELNDAFKEHKLNYWSKK